MPGASGHIRVSVVASHPIQYQAPLFRSLAALTELNVLYAHKASPEDQAAAGFAHQFEWDLDLLDGYSFEFLENIAKDPRLDRYAGCDTPAVLARLQELRPDALLVMGWHLKSFRQAMRAAKRLKIPVMVRGDSHLSTPRNVFKQIAKLAVYPFFLRRFDAALYVGQKSREYWRHYLYPARRLFFSPHCVDNDFFRSQSLGHSSCVARKALGLSPESKIILFAGKLLDCKCPLDLVEACARAQIEISGLCVAFAGSGELESAIQKHAEALGVRCEMLGFRNQSEMPLVYAAADVLVLPSQSETWGLVANEALACGVPIILSDECGAAPDLAADGLAGRVFPMGDINALSDSILDILRNPPSSKQIAERADAYNVGAAAAGILEAMAFLLPHHIPSDDPD